MPAKRARTSSPPAAAAEAAPLPPPQPPVTDATLSTLPPLQTRALQLALAALDPRNAEVINAHITAHQNAPLTFAGHVKRVENTSNQYSFARQPNRNQVRDAEFDMMDTAREMLQAIVAECYKPGRSSATRQNGIKAMSEIGDLLSDFGYGDDIATVFMPCDFGPLVSKLIEMMMRRGEDLGVAHEDDFGELVDALGGGDGEDHENDDPVAL